MCYYYNNNIIIFYNIRVYKYNIYSIFSDIKKGTMYTKYNTDNFVCYNIVI